MSSKVEKIATALIAFSKEHKISLPFACILDEEDDRMILLVDGELSLADLITAQEQCAECSRSLSAQLKGAVADFLDDMSEEDSDADEEEDCDPDSNLPNAAAVRADIETDLSMLMATLSNKNGESN